MREAVFIRRNQERWHQYQHQPAENPEQLAERFVALTDDLAYARTFYPRAPITEHLNSLAASFHQQLYRRRAKARQGLGYFWLTEFPLLLVRHHRTMLAALGLFVLFCGLGWLSAAEDDMFVRLVMGDEYVNMTLENIRRGRPMGVYGSMPEGITFMMIAFNNVKVALAAFALGIVGTLGTIFVLFRNGLMLGSFQYFFFEQGTGLESVLTIWVHGTIEISCIVLAGGAGMVLGNSLLFPGSFPRGESLRRGAQDAVRLAVGLIPLIVLAAFIEGFFTRLAPTHPYSVSLPIIGCSLLLVLGYFVVYPWWLQRRVAQGQLTLPDGDDEAPL